MKRHSEHCCRPLYLRRMLLTVFACALVLPSTAYAIPSPDVIVNIFASAGQLLGLLSVLFGASLVGRRSTYGANARRGSSAINGKILLAMLVLLLVSVGANVLLYSSNIDAQNRRLYANLTRASIEKGKRVGDVNLKTLSMSQQLVHPLAVSTEDFAKLWRFQDFAKRFEFIDVRTPEEFEMGALAGARHIVQADLPLHEEELRAVGKPLILMCESGNRSGELCTKLNEKGFNCNFLIGGFEKWISEGRPTEGISAESTERVRDIAPYRNKEVLFDTPEVERLVAEENAVFVDVRYPGDFELYHLPNAINVPLRQLNTQEWTRQLQSLPDRPIIAPCYDKRSCFYAMILGLRLSRMDKDFRGRYTVPHDYVGTTAAAAQMRAQREGERTFFTILRTPLDGLLSAASEFSGSFVHGVLLFILALRLFFLPLSAKSDRDQELLRAKEDELNELKAKTAKNPSRQSRALLQWYKAHRLTPVVNLLASIVQLLVFLMCFFTVQEYAKTMSDSFLWAEKPVQADPTFAMPLGVGILTFLLLQQGARSNAARALIIRLLCSAAMVWLVLSLSIAVNFYLVANLSLLLVQNMLLRGLFRRRLRNTKQEAETDAAIVPLDQAHKARRVGNKAARLGQLLEAGFPVPNGIVVTDLAFHSNGHGPAVQDEHREALQSVLSNLQGARFAVRSSGLAEDGAEQSYAGIFESLLNVELPSVQEAIQEVRRSFSSETAAEYGGAEAQGTGAVLVQEMVPAEYAGVYFTEHPTESGSSLVEMTAGLGEALVSGETNAMSFRFGRSSGQLLDGTAPPIPLDELLQLGAKAEKLFERPQDIEWAYRDGQFFILQARDITALARKNADTGNKEWLFEQERHRLLELGRDAAPDELLFEQNELAEILPRPTPLSLSLMSRLWAPGGTADLACQSLGVPYEIPEDAKPLYITAFGGLYLNRLEERRRASRDLSALASFRLSRAADQLEAEFREDFLPRFLREMETLSLADLTRCSDAQLFRLLDERLTRFAEETYVHAERINVAAEFYLAAAERMLRTRGHSPAAYLADLPPTEPFRILALLPKVKEGVVSIDEVLSSYGHRAFNDFELSAPRFAEAPEQLELLMGHTFAKSDAQPTEPLKGKVLQQAVRCARTFQSLKEDAKHYTLHELAFVRRLLLEIDRRWQGDGGVFYLTLEELCTAAAPSEDLRARIERRRAEEKLFAEVQLPTKITARQLESLDFKKRASALSVSPLNAALAGTLVAGSAEVTGKARVLTCASQLGEFQPGEILVTRFTTPQWTPLFSKASGVVTEVGGWLSHAAILAREYNLTTIVGVGGALELIRTGDTIRLCLDGRIEQV